jgi:uncharacterized RDD family membrane protein YckC
MSEEKITKTKTLQQYPLVVDRVKSVFADSLVIVAMMYLASYMFSFMTDVDDNMRIAALIVILMYDPIFVSLFGFTIGHYIMGLRVRKESNEQRKIIIPLAMLRFVLKTLLGWLSLITVTRDDKGQAIHDLFTGSVVIFAKPRTYQITEEVIDQGHSDTE